LKKLNNSNLLDILLSLTPKITLKALLIGHTGSISSLVYLNGHIITGSADSIIRVWKDYKCIKIIEEHIREITCLLALPNGYLAAGSADFAITIYNSNMRYHLVINLFAHNKAISGLVSLPNNRMASCSWDGTIVIWDTISLISIYTLENFSIEFMLLTTGGLVVYRENESFDIYDISDYTIKKSLHWSKMIRCMLELPNGSLAVSERMAISIIDPNDDYKCVNIIDTKFNIYSMILLDDYLIGTTSGKKIVIWEGEEYLKEICISNNGFKIFSLRGKEFATYSNDNSINMEI
jgi:WD40 repeat protein